MGTREKKTDKICIEILILIGIGVHICGTLIDRREVLNNAAIKIILIGFFKAQIKEKQEEAFKRFQL